MTEALTIWQPRLSRRAQLAGRAGAPRSRMRVAPAAAEARAATGSVARARSQQVI